MAREPFRAEILTGNDPLLIQLEGDIDRDASVRLEEVASELLTASPRLAVLDFRRTGYINSTGIALIVALLAKTRAAGVVLEAVGLSDHYRHVFEITRLSDFITIRDELATPDLTQEGVTSS